MIDRFFVPQGTAEELREARSRIAYLDLETAYDLLQDGQIEAAGKVHQDLSAAAGGVSHRAAEQIRRLAQDLESQRLSNRYNEAIDRYNAGDFAAATEILQEVLAGTQDAGLVLRVRELLETALKQLDGGG